MRDSFAGCRTPCANVFESATADDRFGVLLHVPFRVHEGVAMFDQQPFVFVAGLFQLHEDKTAAKLFAVELKLKIAFRELVFDAERPFRRIRALIPYDHFAAAVFAFGDGAFEISIFERMIFDLHRESLVAGIQRRPFGTAQDFRTPSTSRRKS